jgi:ATP-dependent Zn protease
MRRSSAGRSLIEAVLETAATMSLLSQSTRFKNRVSKHRPSQRRLAIHEAGHAVVANRLAIAVHDISLIRDGDCYASTRIGVVIDSNEAPAFLRINRLSRELAVNIAGIVAEQLTGFLPAGKKQFSKLLTRSTGYGLDLDSAIGRAAKISYIKEVMYFEAGEDYEPEDIYDIIMREWEAVTRMLQQADCWADVERVSSELRKRKRLTRSQFKRIVGDRR